MKYEILLSDESEIDVIESYSYFCSIDVKLGEKFIFEIDKALDFISENHSIFSPIYQNIRRYLVKKFPFIIYYKVDYVCLEVKIIGILHASRNPEKWKKRN
ncbi:MAG: hypothetical protein A2086_01075 [Spirochaetes bacterium GWD1_27_9]|nr:MAG: hypothetical protein A2Z98_16005 [Spirochaetes bacterium GWB1_27_13]OHD33644.1 MAG: hypothetical protein A2086_01075 [Spirochaetes bacterium GWD1_27_9]